MDFPSEARHLFDKLSIWRDDSHKELSNIIQVHNNTINNDINDLRIRLSMITRERNDLLETVHNLNNDIRQRNVLYGTQPEVMHRKAIQAISPEAEVNREQNVETSTISSETGYSDDITFNESIDLDNARNEEMTSDKKEEKKMQVEIMGGKNKRENIPVDSASCKSLQHKSTLSRNTDHGDNHTSPDCNFSSEKLGIHQKNFHPKLDLINNSKSIQERGDKKFKCGQCPYTSAKSDNVKQHTKAVHDNIKNHICDVCGYAAAQNAVLKKHIEGVHENIKNHVCEKCGYTASQTSHLKIHIKAVHENIRNHVCRDCGYAASLKSDLEKHIKAVHENIKNHFCGECGYAASRKARLQQHINSVHENIRNHACGDCEYAASEKGKLKRHQESVHNSGNKKYTCEICSYKAYRKEDLKRHMNRVHYRK